MVGWWDSQIFTLLLASVEQVVYWEPRWHCQTRQSSLRRKRQILRAIPIHQHGVLW